MRKSSPDSRAYDFTPPSRNSSNQSIKKEKQKPKENQNDDLKATLRRLRFLKTQRFREMKPIDATNSKLAKEEEKLRAMDAQIGELERGNQVCLARVEQFKNKFCAESARRSHLKTTFVQAGEEIKKLNQKKIESEKLKAYCLKIEHHLQLEMAEIQKLEKELRKLSAQKQQQLSRNSSQRSSSQRNSSQRNSSQRNSSQRNSSQRNSSQRNSSQRNSSQRASVSAENISVAREYSHSRSFSSDSRNERLSEEWPVLSRTVNLESEAEASQDLRSRASISRSLPSSQRSSQRSYARRVDDERMSQQQHPKIAFMRRERHDTSPAQTEMLSSFNTQRLFRANDVFRPMFPMHNRPAQSTGSSNHHVSSARTSAAREVQNVAERGAQRKEASVASVPKFFRKFLHK